LMATSVRFILSCLTVYRDKESCPVSLCVFRALNVGMMQSVVPFWRIKYY
jgi:hypothetical protein